MKNQIIIREAISEADTAAFWEQLHSYHKRDIFPDPEDENLKHFLSDTEYRVQIEHVHNRLQDRCYYLFFERNSQDIGFALPAIFTSEDGKCFILEFCIFPEFRGGGTGRECAAVLLEWAKEHGARYAELNYGGDEQRLRFWKRVGFVENGVDEWGEPLMLLPPAETVPFTVEILKDPVDWQLLKLENGFKREIGEESLTKIQQKQLQQAVRVGRITFFFAKRGYRTVGMCSVAAYYSTFSCSNVGVFEVFYIEPAFRNRGTARKLAEAAQSWCRENDIASLTVCCAACDEAMYQALGFNTSLGTTFANMG
jgi:GNAT superfamily N-acetyltransferase